MAAIAYHVVDRFLLRLPASSGSFVSNGDNLYSYGLRLAHWEENEIVIDFEGRAPCPFLSCEDKANGRPHYHYFALGETKTAYPIDGQTSIGFEEAAKLVRP